MKKILLFLFGMWIFGLLVAIPNMVNVAKNKDETQSNKGTIKIEDNRSEPQTLEAIYNHTKNDDYLFDAYYLCKELVKKRLKAPSTAKFAKRRQSNIWIEKNDINVVSYVDSQNSFGAMVRTKYLCILFYDINTSKYYLKDLRFLE